MKTKLDVFLEELGEKNFINCDICKFWFKDRVCKKQEGCPRLTEFFNEVMKEYKKPVELTDEERVILKSLDPLYKWIARDSQKNDNDLYVYMSEPCKSVTVWMDENSTYLSLAVYNHLFQFISWDDDKPYLIEELLKDGE